MIVWSVLFVPAIYFFWPETARLSLEEIGKQFGDEVAVHITDVTAEERAAVDRKLTQHENVEARDNKVLDTSDTAEEIQSSRTSDAASRV